MNLEEFSEISDNYQTKA